jgi:hypothetical protein
MLQQQKSGSDKLKFLAMMLLRQTEVDVTLPITPDG